MNEPDTTINDKPNINSSNINGKSAQLQVGSKVAILNVSTVALDTSTYINKSNNSVYVPLIFVYLELVGEDNMIIDGESIDMGNIISPKIKRRTSICTI